MRVSIHAWLFFLMLQYLLPGPNDLQTIYNYSIRSQDWQCWWKVGLWSYWNLQVCLIWLKLRNMIIYYEYSTLAMPTWIHICRCQIVMQRLGSSTWYWPSVSRRKWIKKFFNIVMMGYNFVLFAFEHLCATPSMLAQLSRVHSNDGALHHHFPANCQNGRSQSQNRPVLDSNLISTMQDFFFIGIISAM